MYDRLWALDPREGFPWVPDESALQCEQLFPEAEPSPPRPELVYTIFTNRRYCPEVIVKVVDFEPTEGDCEEAVREHVRELLWQGRGMEEAEYAREQEATFKAFENYGYRAYKLEGKSNGRSQSDGGGDDTGDSAGGGTQSV